MTKKKNHDEFIDEVFEKVGKEYCVLSEYKSTHVKVSMLHSICGNTYSVSPSAFLSGQRCPICFNNKRGDSLRSTTILFMNLVSSVCGEEYTVLGEYITQNTPLLMRHNVCGHVWNQRPSKFIHRSSRCPKCSTISRGINSRKTHTLFKSQVSELVGSEYIVIGKYIDSKTKVEIKHVICGNIWLASPANFVNNGRRCPFCSSSKGEQKISLFLKSRNITFKREFKIGCVNIIELPFDFYLPDYNMLVEYDGILHYEDKFNNPLEFSKTKVRDKIKTTFCKDNNIPLLRIPYWGFDNIEKILNEALRL